MSQHARVKENGGTAFVVFNHSKLMERDADAICKELHDDIVLNHRRRFILCCKGVDFIALKVVLKFIELRTMLSSISGSGTSIGFCCLHPSIALTLEMAGLMNDFKVCSEQEERKALSIVGANIMAA